MPMFDEAESDIRFVMRWLGFKARTYYPIMPDAMDSDDLVQAGYMAYHRGVIRNKIQDKPVRERTAIMASRVKGQMIDEIRRVGSWTRSFKHPNPLNVLNSEFVDAGGPAVSSFGVLEVALPPARSAETTAVLLLQIHEIFGDIGDNASDFHRDVFIRRVVHQERLEAIGSVYGISGSRVCQIVAEVREIVMKRHCLEDLPS